MGYEDVAEFAFFNRDWYLQRVCFPPRKGSKAYALLHKVLDYLKNNKHFNEFVTPDIEKFISGWAR